MRRGVITVLLCTDVVVTAAIGACAIDLSHAIACNATVDRVAHAVSFSGRRLALAGRVLLRGA